MKQNMQDLCNNSTLLTRQFRFVQIYDQYGEMPQFKLVFLYTY